MESPRMESPRTAAQQHSLMINTGAIAQQQAASV